MMKNTMNLLLGIFLVLCSLFAGCEQQDRPAPAVPRPQTDYEGTIVAVGDSLTAGLGVSERDAYPARLERKLRETGLHWRVINAGISGETSSGARSRVNWTLKLIPDIVILETGANDGLRGIDPAVTRRNIDETVRILKQNRVVVVLAGMRMFTNLGRDYTKAFAELYPAVAKKHDVILVPFFLEGVAGDPALNQADGIHPTAEGYRTITETVHAHVLKAIRQAGKR